MRKVKLYSKEVTAERLRALRENKGWSLRRMGDELKALIGGSEKGQLVLEGDNGKQTVAQLESKSSSRVISLNAAMAYAKIFDVTLDYIYGTSNHKNPEIKDAASLTGLTDDAVKTVARNNKSIPYFADVLSMILANENCGDLISICVGVKMAKYKLDFHSALPMAELATTYKRSHFQKAKSDEEKSAAREVLLKELQEAYEVERWRVSYKLSLILDALNSLEIYTAEEWVEQEYKNIKRAANRKVSVKEDKPKEANNGK